MRLFLTLAVLLLLAGCARPTAPLTSAPAPLDDVMADALSGLPAPADVPRGTSAASGLERYGAEFLPFLANRVTAAGALGSFDPDFAAPGAPASALAYAAYQFDATGLSGAGSLEANWHTAPAAGNGVVGLSHWTSGRWEWRLLSGAGISVELDDIAPYIHPDDGRLLALVLVGGTDGAHLSELKLRLEPETPHWRLSQLTINHSVVRFLRQFELQGKPAVTYISGVDDPDTPENKLMLQRALDPLGAKWGEPELVWEIPRDALYNGAVLDAYPLMVEGRLSIAIELGGQDVDFLYRIHYLRATNDAATEFAPATQVHESYEAYAQLKGVELVQGQMAVLLHDYLGEIYIVKRANDASGALWSFSLVDSTDGTSTTPPYGILTAGGFGSVLYPYLRYDLPGEPVEIRFRRATDAQMTAWAAPRAALPPGSGLFNPYLPLTLADGRPAFLYGSGASTAFMAALDTAGDDWPLLGTVVPGMAGASALAIETIGGVPALSYRRNDPEALYYRPAVDALGADWEDPQPVYSGISSGAHMGEFDGHPALAATLPGGGLSRYPVFFIYR